MKFISAIFCSTAFGIDPNILADIESSGGLSAFTHAQASADLKELINFTTIHPGLFRVIQTEVIPFLQYSLATSTMSFADLSLACANEIITKLDPSMPFKKAALWCSVAQSSQNESFLTLSLNDEGFNRFVAPLLRRMQKKRPIEESVVSDNQRGQVAPSIPIETAEGSETPFSISSEDLANITIDFLDEEIEFDFETQESGIGQSETHSMSSNTIQTGEGSQPVSADLSNVPTDRSGEEAIAFQEVVEETTVDRSKRLPPIFHINEYFIRNTDPSRLGLKEVLRGRAGLKGRRSDYPVIVQGELSQDEAEINNFVEKISLEERKNVLKILYASRTRIHMLNRIAGMTNLNSRWFARYIVSSAFIPGSVLRLLVDVSLSEDIEGLPNPVTAAKIVEFFKQKDANYGYLTSERIIEWYNLIINCPNLIMQGSLEDTRHPEYTPRISFGFDSWKRCLLVNRPEYSHSIQINESIAK